MPVREPVGLLPGSDDRPADAIVRTILLKLQLSVLQAASLVTEGAGHCGKVRKYKERCANKGITFTPQGLAVEALESWHPVGMAPITRLGRQLARNIRQGRTYSIVSLKQICMMAFYL